MGCGVYDRNAAAAVVTNTTTASIALTTKAVHSLTSEGTWEVAKRLKIQPTAVTTTARHLQPGTNLVSKGGVSRCVLSQPRLSTNAH